MGAPPDAVAVVGIVEWHYRATPADGKSADWRLVPIPPALDHEPSADEVKTFAEGDYAARQWQRVATRPVNQPPFEPPTPPSA